MIYDVLIIGSGPSGLTAGIYTSRASLTTLLLAGKKWGGQLQLTTEVENFPGFPEGIQGPQLMMNMRKQAERFGTQIVDKEAVKLDVYKKPFSVLTDNEAYQARSVIIATGADTVWLGVKGEQEFIGKGVSSCAPCDAFFYKEKTVAVVGGGDSAMEEALVLTKFAQKVIVIHRRESFKASKIMQERVLKHPKIEVIWNTEIQEIKGEKTVYSTILNSKVKSKNVKPQLKTQNFNGTVISSSQNEITWEMPVDGIFVAIGHKPNSELFKDILDIDGNGFVLRKPITDNRLPITDYPTMTKIPGVFVAGDVWDFRYKQAVTAAGYGCEAALDAERWLENNS
jgi:thioredoxin reductase (NADPH)